MRRWLFFSLFLLTAVHLFSQTKEDSLQYATLLSYNFESKQLTYLNCFQSIDNLYQPDAQGNVFHNLDKGAYENYGFSGDLRSFGETYGQLLQLNDGETFISKRGNFLDSKYEPDVYFLLDKNFNFLKDGIIGISRFNDDLVGHSGLTRDTLLTRGLHPKESYSDRKESYSGSESFYPFVQNKHIYFLTVSEPEKKGDSSNTRTKSCRLFDPFDSTGNANELFIQLPDCKVWKNNFFSNSNGDLISFYTDPSYNGTAQLICLDISRKKIKFSVPDTFGVGAVYSTVTGGIISAENDYLGHRGNSVVFFKDDGSIRSRMPLDTNLFPARETFSIEISPDSKLLAVFNQYNICVYDLRDNKIKANLKNNNRETSFTGVKFTPDGHNLTIGRKFNKPRNILHILVVGVDSAMGSDFIGVGNKKNTERAKVFTDEMIKCTFGMYAYTDTHLMIDSNATTQKLLALLQSGFPNDFEPAMRYSTVKLPSERLDVYCFLVLSQYLIDSSGETTVVLSDSKLNTTHHIVTNTIKYSEFEKSLKNTGFGILLSDVKPFYGDLGQGNIISANSDNKENAKGVTMTPSNIKKSHSHGKLIPGGNFLSALSENNIFNDYSGKEKSYFIYTCPDIDIVASMMKGITGYAHLGCSSSEDNDRIITTSELNAYFSSFNSGKIEYTGNIPFCRVQQNKYFDADVTPPVIELVNEKDATGNRISITDRIVVKVKATDDKAVHRVLINGKDAEAMSNDIYQKEVFLKVGDNEIAAIAEDLSGNTARLALNVIREDTTNTPKQYAIFFATKDYQDPTWPQLKNPVNDANAIAADLAGKYGFDTIIYRNPTIAQIENGLEVSMNRKYKDADQLFVYFSGHGYYKENTQEGFIVAADSKAEVTTSCFPFSRLQDMLSQKHHCKHIFLVLDACYSGTFFNSCVALKGDEVSPLKGLVLPKDTALFNSSDFQELTEKPSRFTLTSSGTKPSLDGAGDHSPLTEFLLTNLASKQKGDILDVYDIRSDMNKKLKALKTTPHFGDFGNNSDPGDFLFIRNR